MLERGSREVGDRNGDLRDGFRSVGAPADDVTFDPLHGYRIEADLEQEAVGVDDLDRLTWTRPERSRKVPRVAALDDHAAVLAAPEERWQLATSR